MVSHLIRDAAPVKQDGVLIPQLIQLIHQLLSPSLYLILRVRISHQVSKRPAYHHGIQVKDLGVADATHLSSQKEGLHMSLPGDMRRKSGKRHKRCTYTLPPHHIHMLFAC
jgi:hypothetical protein